MIIEAQDLRKTFKSRAKRGSRTPEIVEAVKGVDLSVETGEIFGVLGPNGAGKTTTIRMLATLITPTGGTATVAGHDLLAAPEDVRRSIGYVSQAGGVDDNNGPRANLMLAARLNGLTAAEAAARTEEMMAAFDLSGFADRPARTLSGGQKRRVALALGLVHRPPLLFLDEPTTGLDPQNRANLWDQIKALREQGTSVLLSTHYLDEADSLCDRLVIVDHGLIVAEGTPGDLKREVAGDVVSLRVSDTAAASEAVKALPYPREVRIDGDLLRIYLDDGEHALPQLLATLAEHDLAIQSISLERATLDDVFLHKTGRSLRDAA
ncbi:ATP-binding cassette domain-containing protein [Planotetraspora sp. A-T 1434]|uniref:ATP-binding cassette domain-containing protein n=1 Tax=Planotetraspora sp. A-T 1434 TaxID=2979219 RepID=UPI0021C0E706|nr:ATP-binding cassette domain-containing protein [Planotetraspora sp. A-T 1434]MCT9929173.1 ATP-binding cassette domain-containing protein [Planotetraspora sp. A-T 1434]